MGAYRCVTIDVQLCGVRVHDRKLGFTIGSWGSRSEVGVHSLARTRAVAKVVEATEEVWARCGGVEIWWWRWRRWRRRGRRVRRPRGRRRRGRRRRWVPRAAAARVAATGAAAARAAATEVAVGGEGGGGRGTGSGDASGRKQPKQPASTRRRTEMAPRVPRRTGGGVPGLGERERGGGASRGGE